MAVKGMVQQGKAAVDCPACPRGTQLQRLLRYAYVAAASTLLGAYEATTLRLYRDVVAIRRSWQHARASQGTPQGIAGVANIAAIYS
jgi:hypothetical protein